MRKTRAAFRALREECGYTQTDIANIFDIDRRSVRRWEAGNDEGWYEPPDDVFQWLVEESARMRANARMYHDELVLVAAEQEYSGCLALAYYRTQEELDAVQGDRGEHVGFVNATTRMVARMLEDEGYDVLICYKEQE